MLLLSLCFFSVVKPCVLQYKKSKKSCKEKLISRDVFFIVMKDVSSAASRKCRAAAGFDAV